MFDWLRDGDPGEIAIAAGLAVLAAAIVGGTAFAFINNDNKYQKALQETAEIVSAKVQEDIFNLSEIPLGDDYVIDVSHITLDQGKNLVGTSEKSLNVYGVINEEIVFKNQYNLSDTQLAELKKGNEREVIEALGRIFETLELTKHDFSDYKAMSLGLTEEKDFEKLTKVLGPAIPKSGFFKDDQNQTPDMFLPVYSKIGVVEKDGKQYAVLDVEGIEMHKKSTPNVGMGLMFGSSMYTNSGNLSLSYAYGISMAYATAIKKSDAYARVERFVVEIDAQTATMSNEELREYFVSGILDGTLNYQKETQKYSENLSNNKTKYYSDLFEK